MSAGSVVANDAARAAAREVVQRARPRLLAESLAAASILLGAAAQLIVKDALLFWNAHPAARSVSSGILEPAGGVLFGLFVYAIGTLFWLKAVERAAISRLYPLGAGSYVLVAMGGHFLFRERIDAFRWAGIAVITLGVALLALSNLRGSQCHP